MQKTILKGVEMKRNEFNKRWYPIIKETINVLDKENLLNINKERIVSVDNMVVSTNRREAIIADMVEKSLNLNLYTIKDIEVISRNGEFKSFLKNVLETIVSKILTEKEEIVSDTEYKMLVELMLKTVLVSMDDSIGPIFQVNIRNSYINVYPRYLVIFNIEENGGRRTVKNLTKTELVKQLLGEFRRQVKLKDKWVPMAYELYVQYNCEGFIREVDLEKRLNLLEEKTELVARFEINIKEFVKLFTAIPKEEIDKMSIHELAFIKNSLMQLSYIWRLIKKGENISLDRQIPPYFKVSVKFK